MRAWALIGLAALLAGCEAPLPQAGQNPRDEPSLAFEGFRARGTREGEKQWEARAIRARVYQGRQWAVAERVDITYFQDGRAVSFAVAGNAEIDLATYNLRAHGGVRVRGVNGVTLLSESLSWDNQRQRVSSDDFVKVIRGKSTLSGVGLRADRKLERVDVLRDVKLSTASLQELRQTRPGDLRAPR
jgi:LPS export ABC transporter protein LptC